MRDLKLMTGLSLMLSLLLFNCSTPSNLLQDGDYDEAVYKAIQNLRKKKKKKEKDIIVVEEAFRKITSRDMREIAALKAEGQAKNWVRINELHNRIKDRQDLIYPYLPLVATKTHYEADFKFVKIVPLEIDSRKKAAAYYYNTGKGLLQDAKRGNKQLARSAYRKFMNVRSYFDNFKDNNLLMNEAYEIGLDKVVLEMRNSSFAIIPRGFEDELLAFNERNLDNEWTHYYKAYNAPADIDYKVIIDITQIDVSPEQIREQQYILAKELTRTEQREVVQTIGGGKTTKGASDSLALSQVVVEEYEVPFTVEAEVLDVYQTKSAFVQARVSFYESNNKTLLETDRVNATINFENISTTFRGDRRALSSDVLNRLGGAPVPFPTDSELVFDAAAVLKGKITNSIRGAARYAIR
jgi:hypothetical protein